MVMAMKEQQSRSPSTVIPGWNRATASVRCRCSQSRCGGPSYPSKTNHRFTTHADRLRPRLEGGWLPVAVQRDALRAALLHESDVARNDPNPTVGHRLIAYDAGLPKSVIRFSTLHARTASVPCPAELRARRPSLMIDLYRKKTFSTRACRW